MPDQVNLESQLRIGDEGALAALWEEHRPRLVRLIAARLDPRLPRRVDPDDVLQEAFLAARTRIGHFASDGFQSSFIWCRLIVVQTVIDLHRAHLGAAKRDAAREVAGAAGAAGGDDISHDTLVEQLSGSVTSPSRRLLAGERNALVRRAIADLSPADREILSLRHVDQLTNNEAAEALGIEVKAASIRYVRALRRLKEMLARHGGLTSEFLRGD